MKRTLKSLQLTPGFKQHLPEKDYSFSIKSSSESLRVAWITGDCRYHPVSRFLMGSLSSLAGQFKHQHHVVSTRPLEDKIPELYEGIEGVELHDFSAPNVHHKTRIIRDLKADIAIDLSGWTDGNFAPAFISRVAPIQINYLGYFGSTGIPAMDWWLGDSYLFPTPMRQWHSEKVYRLPRCFIAWQPHPEFPEASVAVPEARSGPIRFGCFNHLRKLTDITLQTWSKILNSIPSSRLVLKAAGFEDSTALCLLRRRLLRAGLEPEKIDYLPFAPTISEHLLQYREIDIALDPFPNGGCTTTCEALWMGVPVITLAGNSYVSRMSSSVLHGAGMKNWVADDLNSYIDLTVKYADTLVELRSGREDLRRRLKKSELGNGNQLMRTIESCFDKMVNVN